MSISYAEFFHYTESAPAPKPSKYESHKFCERCGALKFRISTEARALTFDECKGWDKYDPRFSTRDARWKCGPIKKWFGTDQYESAWFKCLLRAECLHCSRTTPEGSHTEVVMYARPMCRFREILLFVKSSHWFAPVLQRHRSLKYRIVSFMSQPTVSRYKGNGVIAYLQATRLGMGIARLFL